MHKLCIHLFNTNFEINQSINEIIKFLSWIHLDVIRTSNNHRLYKTYDNIQQLTRGYHTDQCKNRLYINIHYAILRRY